MSVPDAARPATDDEQTLAALGDRSRRALYDYVRHQAHPVNREEAADATGISRKLAAFHLDKLVDAGLLAARYEARPDRPRGRGRTPKVYEPTGEGLAVTIPPRRYELIAQILAAAVERQPADAERAAQREAYQQGRRLGAEHAAPGPRRTGGHGDRRVVAALGELGFEPESRDRRVLLHNCPFHALAVRHTALVCGLNHAFVTGLIEGLDGQHGQSTLTAHLQPGIAACCVTLTTEPGQPGQPGQPSQPGPPGPPGPPGQPGQPG